MEKASAMDVMGLTVADEKEEASRGRTAETLLRILPMGLSLAALLVMLRDKQMKQDFGAVSYNDVGGFKYLVYANGLCAGYSLLSALCVAVPPCTTKCRNWALFCCDQVLTYLILAAGAACTEVIYLAYNGDIDITWSEACSTFGSFCRKATASVGITFAAVVCYVALSLISSYRLFSAFESPCTGASVKRIESASSPSEQRGRQL